MGFLTKLASGVTKVALTPISVVKDAADVAEGKEPKTTKKTLESSAKDYKESLDDLCEGDFI